MCGCALPWCTGHIGAHAAATMLLEAPLSVADVPMPCGGKSFNKKLSQILPYPYEENVMWGA
jgi:hypothetical protein